MKDIKKIKVKIVNGDHTVLNLFKNKKGIGYEFSILKDDIHSVPDLIVFTGGPDVNPKLYDEVPIRGTHFVEHRDKEDIYWFDKYLTIPKVGICRGGQLLNVLSGGSMWQDVNNHLGNHTLINLLPIPARRDMGDEIRVSSTHHQMMIAGEGGEVIAIAMDDKKMHGRATAYSSAKDKDFPDFDTEVVWYETTKSLCYQPHPEHFNQEENTKYFFDLLDFFYFGE